MACILSVCVRGREKNRVNAGRETTRVLAVWEKDGGRTKE